MVVTIIEAMKKKLFIVLGGCALIFIGAILLNMKKHIKSNSDILRLAFPYKKKVNEYEPTKIHLAPEYIFLENIFSPLIELSKDEGTPISGVAKKFYWINNELHFEIRDDLYTIDGYKITAKDVEFSLKRVLILSKNTHGNLKDLICAGEVPKTISEPCHGMEISNNKLILKPDRQNPFLLKMLAAIDFAIVPIPSMDSETLKIKDYKNTSGPYYVAEDDGQGNILLMANERHFHFNKKMPRGVKLVPSGMSGIPDSLTQFKENKIDFITTVDMLRPKEVIQFSKKNLDSELHQTLGIRTYVAIYTKKGLSRLSVKKRLAIGKVLKNLFRSHYQSIPEYKPTDQFFPAYGDGELKKDQLKNLHEILKNAESIKDASDIHLSIVIRGNSNEFVKLIKGYFPKIKITEDKSIPAFTQYANESEIPDVFLGSTDTGFMEDIGLITYSIKAGFFGLGKKEGQKWLKQYMEILDEEKRLKKLKELHFKSLSEGVLIPLVSAPYVALIRKPWKMELPQIYGNSQLWLIKKN